MMFPVPVPRRLSVVVLAVFVALGGCAPGESDPELDNTYRGDDDDDDDGGGLGVTDPTLVIRWAQLGMDHATALGTDLTDPFPNGRAFTMMFLAMHDALNAIEPKYRQYAFTGSDPSADPIAAGARAAHQVLNHTFPNRQAENDAELNFWLSQVPDGLAKNAGINLGINAANAIINRRANDNMLVVGSYTPDDPLEPGDYTFTPPFPFVYRPAFGDATPFTIGNVSSFLPAPPPALTSSTYASRMNEVQQFGEKNSTFRSQDQTNLAQWWLEFNEMQWTRFMQIITENRNLALIDAVRMFALGNMAQIDSSVAVWFAKRHYDFWRPFHASRQADLDGNPATVADPTWEPQHDTPPLWEYPSAHTIQCWAIAETLKSVLGTDNVSFEAQSSTAPAADPVRSFNKLSQAANECGVSRIMAGFHYRFAVDASVEMGKRVGRKVKDTALRRR